MLIDELEELHMNRAILTLILSGSSILVANLFFYFVPIEIFPCTRSFADHLTVQSLCSIAEVTKSQEFVIAQLTGFGQFVQFIVTWVAPIVVSIAIVLSTSKRSPSRSPSNAEQLP